MDALRDATCVVENADFLFISITWRFAATQVAAQTTMEDQNPLLDLGIALGQQHAFAIVAGRCSAAQAETLRRIREEKLYLHCSPLWREFCPQYLGMSSSQADRIIHLLDEFGPKYFSVAQLTRISAEVYRAIAPAVQDGVLEYNGQTIELAPENARAVTAAVTALRREAEVKKPPPPPPPPPDRLGELNRRFESLLEDVSAARPGAPEAQALAQTLSSMVTRFGIVMLRKAA
jgi:hypothetical protein